MEKLLKIDPHVHSSGISLCSHVSVVEIVEEKIALGYDGAVLTNHCQAWYYPKIEHKNYVERVIEEYHRGKAYADARGFRLYLGLEVTLDIPHYADWLLYGVTEEFLRASPCLYTLSQEELFKLCDKWGIVLVQAHPFREGQGPCEPNFMHGVEINCSHNDLNKVEFVESFAKEHNLIVTCGIDYHTKAQTYFAGILLPESCETSTDIAAYFKEKQGVTVFRDGKITEYKGEI